MGGPFRRRLRSPDPPQRNVQAGEGAVSYSGPVKLDYAPERDGEPDPGEVVWTWVPYEEDATQGKDRPLLVVGRAEEAGGYVALMLSSRDHRGEHGWVHLGQGTWDDDERESWLKVDRMLLVRDGGIRREGAVLDRRRFLDVLDKVGRELRGEQVD